MSTSTAEIEELRERLRRLEHAASRPCGSTNMVGAAVYLNRSRRVGLFLLAHAFAPLGITGRPFQCNE